MKKRLTELRERLWNDFGKMTRWELLCKKHHAITEGEKIHLAEQTLAEPLIGTVAKWYSYWASLHGFVSPRLKGLIKQLNMAKLLHFQRLCKERNAATAEEQMEIAEEVAAWSDLDGVGAAQVAWLQVKGGVKTKKATPYKPTGF